MWILRLNPMNGKAESVVAVAQAETREAIEVFLGRERVEPYKEDRFYKVFRKGGPLEWYNPPDARGWAWVNVPAIVDAGTEADWMARAVEEFRQLRASLHAA